MMESSNQLATGAGLDIPLIRVIAMILILSLLVFVLIWVRRKYSSLPVMDWLSTKPQSQRISVLEQVRLSPSQSLYIVEVDSKEYLIGSSTTNISLVANLQAKAGKTNES